MTYTNFFVKDFFFKMTEWKCQKYIFLVTQFWDMIETLGFREDPKYTSAHHPDPPGGIFLN